MDDWRQILVGWLLGVGMLVYSFAWSAGGVTRPVFYMPEHINLESRDLVREATDGRQLTRYEGRCYRVIRWDASSRDAVPSGTMTKVRRLMDSVPPTDQEWDECAAEFKVSGWVEWVVDRYRLYQTRPLYAWVNGKKGRQIGVVKYGTVCERKRLAPSSWGNQWRYTTNDDEPPIRGAAVCERK